MPCTGGDTAVRIDAGDGSVSGALAYARVKRTESAARRSRLGVSWREPPKAPTRSTRSVSIVMSSRLQPRQLPLSIGRSRCVNHQPLASSATKITAELAETAENTLLLFFCVLCELSG